jgi:hypothetical protein
MHESTYDVGQVGSPREHGNLVGDAGVAEPLGSDSNFEGVGEGS